MIRLKRITLKDYLSHEATEIVFADTERMLLDGDSGSGKSSILDAIVWALYGVGRSDNKSLVRKRQKKAVVTLEIEDTAIHTAYIIERSITAAGKHALSVQMAEEGAEFAAHPESRVRELQQFIENKIVGASYLLFVNSVVYRQEGVDTFVAQTAAKRKELLLELMHATSFDEYYEKTKEKIASILADTNLLVAQKTSLDTLVHEATEAVKRKKGLRRLLDETLLSIAKLQEEQSTIRAALSDANAAKESIVRARGVVTDMEKLLKDAQRNLQDANQADDQLATMEDVERLHATVTKDINETTKVTTECETTLAAIAEVAKSASEKQAQRPVVNDYTTAINALTAQAAVLAGGDQCPSGDACPHQKGRSASLKALNDQINELTEKALKETIAYSTWKSEFNALPAVPDKNPILVKLAEAESARRHLLKTLSELEMSLAKKAALQLIRDKREECRSKVEERAAALAQAQGELERLLAAVDPATVAKLEEECSAVDSRLMSAHSVETTYRVDLAHIERLEAELPANMEKQSATLLKIQTGQDQLNKLSLLKDAFGSKGIRAVAIDYILPGLEGKINEILGQMSDLRVRLDTQQEKMDGDGVKEGLFITTSNAMGEEMPYENLSGGEKVKVTVAISEALATLQRCGFRCYDETLTALDENSLEGFMVVLERLLDRYPQMICISHIQEIKDMFDKKVRIIKHNGTSHVEK